MTHPGPLEKFIAIVGLPRSGTTLLTALLDRHSGLCLYYEPWNASPRNRPPVPKDLAEFRSWMQARYGGDARAGSLVTGFKETMTNAGTTAWAVDTIEALADHCDVRLVWIQRDPVHCLLSKIEGATKWWGHPEMAFSEAMFETFLDETHESYKVLGEMLRKHGGLVVRYEALARTPKTVICEVMAALDERFEAEQLDYYEVAAKDAARKKRMGDPGLIERPLPVSAESIAKRDRQARPHREIIEAVLRRSQHGAVAALFDRYARLPDVARVQPDLGP